jgi:hypothetical protein
VITFADTLTDWALKRGVIERTKVSVNEVASVLGTSWHLAAKWLAGTALPRDRDLPAIALATGIDLGLLRSRVAAERAFKRGEVPTAANDHARPWLPEPGPQPARAFDAGDAEPTTDMRA